MRKVKDIPIAVNSDVMQSSWLTNAKYDVSRTELQIIILLVAAAQSDLNEYMMRNREEGRALDEIPRYDQDIQIAFSLNDFPVDMAGHELELKTAAERLVKKTIETPTETGWILQPLLTKVEYIKQGRRVKMNVPPDIWRSIMDIRLGFSEYELFTALSLKSKYSVRFYMMASSRLGPREISIDELKAQFNLQDKYVGRNADFLRRIVYPAQEELDRKAPVSFTVKPYHKEGSKEFDGIVFSPKRNPNSRDVSLEKKKLTHGRVQVGMVLNEEEIHWLQREDKLGFTKPELNSNFETFNVAKKIYGAGFIDVMNSAYEYMLREGRGGQKGTFIKLMKRRAGLLEQDN